MREIKYTNRFKRDYKREKVGRHGKKLDVVLMEAVNLLAVDALLPRRYFDHPLSGDWSDHRDCNIRPDLVLIYRNQTTIISNSCGSVRIANLVCRRRLEPASIGSIRSRALQV